MCGEDAGLAVKRRLLSAWASLVRVLGRVGGGEVKSGMGSISLQPKHETKFQGCVMPRFKVEELTSISPLAAGCDFALAWGLFLERGDWERAGGVASAYSPALRGLEILEIHK